MTRTRTIAALEDPVLIGVGGFVGAVLRYGVGLLVPGLGGTLVANALGSVALGVLLFAGLAPVGRRTRLLLGTGVLSSFTTYSTFALESAQVGGWLAVGNVVATYVLGLAGALVGLLIADAVGGGDP